MTVTRRTLALTLAGLSPVPLIAMGLAAWAFVRQHDTAETQRRDARNATVLLGMAMCEQNAVFEQLVTRGRSPEERARIGRLFDQYNAPINKALRTLDAKPCERR